MVDTATSSPDLGSSQNGPSRVGFSPRGGFTRIRVAGSPYEMGLQHGEQLRAEIRDLLAAVDHHVLHGQHGVGGWGVRHGVRTVVRMMAAQIPRRYRREIEGMARGADVSYRDLLMLSCFDDVLANLRPLAAIFGRLGCSAFAVTPERTANRDLVCGRNLDYFVMSAQGDDAWAATNYMKEHVVVVEYEPEDRAGFVSIGWPGFAGVATGLSAHGITASALVVQTMRNLPFATPACFLYRRIMEETQTLDEGIELLRRARRTQGHNVLLASGDEGRAAVVEYTPWRFAVRSPEDGWIATTNHFNHPEMVRHYANTTFLSSTERLGRLGELCDAAPVGEVGEAAQFLLDRQRRAAEANEYCTVWNPCTIYSTIFEPARRRMWVRASDKSERSFESIEIATGAVRTIDTGSGSSLHCETRPAPDGV